MLWERIPTSSKLARRHILPPDANTTCIFCKQHTETVRHILFECECSYRLWMLCANWLGVAAVFSSDPMCNLLHFSRMLKGKKGREYGVFIWEGMVWSIWKARNNYIFRNEQFNESKTFDELRSRLWSWIYSKRKEEGFSNMADWFGRPRSCLKC